MTAPEVGRSARVSDDGRYRWDLRRYWGGHTGERDRLLTFVMLNPSTADATQDDPTIRRCMGFARTLDHNGIRVVNLYALRATRPVHLWEADDPVGETNDLWLQAAFATAQQQDALVIAAWGAHGKPDRVAQVVELAAGYHVVLHALHVTKGGAPGHPLYLPADATPRPWPVPA